MNGIHDVGPPGDATDRKTTAKPLRRRDKVRHDPEVLAREHLAGPCHAGLHLVGHKDDPVLLAVVRQAGKESLPRDDHTAFALHRLDEHARDPIAADLLVHRGDGQVRARLPTVLGRRAGGTAVGVAERLTVDLRRERAEARLVRHRFGRERHREQSPSVESVVEHDDGLAAGEGTGDLDGVLDRLGTRVDKEASFLVGRPGRGR